MSIFRLTNQEAKEKMILLYSKLEQLEQKIRDWAEIGDLASVLREYREIVAREINSLEINYPVAKRIFDQEQS